MLSLAQALASRGAAGVPLPAVFPSFEKAGMSICRSQLSLIVGKPGAGKSTFAMVMLALMKVPTLAFVLDSNELTVSARFASIVTKEPYIDIKTAVIDGTKDYRDVLMRELDHIQLCFNAPGVEDVEREIMAFDQRYGLPPDVVLVDNLGNQASGLMDEWAATKALTLEYDALAKRYQLAVIATAHTSDLGGSEPAERTKILGKVTQYPRVILSVGYNENEGRLGVAVVKNTEGPSDPKAERPIIFTADPSRMQISEEPPKVAGVFKRGWGGGFWTPEDD
jgi:energy-coupling factor transporter ATP-binding protein EcfA2